MVTNRDMDTARTAILRSLGLREQSTVRSRIYCNQADLMEVVPAVRPRADMRGGRPHIYIPDRQTKAQEAIGRRYSEINGTLRSEWEGPVFLAVTTHRHMPVTWPARRSGEQDTSAPDADNLIKLVADALKGIAWKDDKQAVGMLSLKAPRRGELDWYEIEVTYCEAAR